MSAIADCYVWLTRKEEIANKTAPMLVIMVNSFRLLAGASQLQPVKMDQMGDDTGIWWLAYVSISSSSVSLASQRKVNCQLNLANADAEGLQEQLCCKNAGIFMLFVSNGQTELPAMTRRTVGLASVSHDPASHSHALVRGI